MTGAAAVVGPVSRPVLLYYAVHQAGKAIAAAWARQGWSPAGHGLSQDGDADAADVLGFRVKPLGGRRRGRSVFATVAGVLGAGGLSGGIELGAAWSALPEVSAPPGGGGWPLALPVWPAIYGYGDAVPLISPTFRGYVCLRGQDLDAAAISDVLSRYPDAAGARLELSQGMLGYRNTPCGRGVPVVWPRPDVEEWFGQLLPEEAAAHVVSRVPVYERTGEHWLIPVVGTGGNDLPQVLLWWVLLFGMSLLARYEPAAWRAALDLDRSPLADPLAELLDQALVIVPDLLFGALTREGAEA